MLDTRLPSSNVLGRALRLLDALSHDFRLELKSLCDATGLSKPTARRILTDLMSAGLVVQDGRYGEYRLTSLLRSLGARVDDRALVLDSIADCARDLTMRRSWPVAVGFLQANQIVVSFSTRALTSMKLKPTTLYEALPLTSAMGQAALATLSERELERVLAQEAMRDAPSFSEASLLQLVKAARTAGYGLRITGRHGASSVAVGLNFGGPAIGAIVATVFEKVVSDDLIRSLASDLTVARDLARQAYSQASMRPSV
jgi:DNA-binding IclR family transcriptional regulator